MSCKLVKPKFKVRKVASRFRRLTTIRRPANFGKVLGSFKDRDYGLFIRDIRPGKSFFIWFHLFTEDKIMIRRILRSVPLQLLHFHAANATGLIKLIMPVSPRPLPSRYHRIYAGRMLYVFAFSA
jgi:hypothetical protein